MDRILEGANPTDRRRVVGVGIRHEVLDARELGLIFRQEEERHRRGPDVLENAWHGPVGIPDADVEAWGRLILEPHQRLVQIRRLGIRVEGRRGAAPHGEMPCRTEGDDVRGNGPGQRRIVVIRAHDSRVLRQGAGRKIVRDLGIETPPVAEDLGFASTGGIVGRADARGPVLVPRERVRRASQERADELLPLVADARPKRQAIANLPAILHEEVCVLLRRMACEVVEVRTEHAIDSAEHRIGKNGHQGAGHRPRAVDQRDGRTGKIRNVVKRNVLELDAVPELMTGEHVGGLCLILPVHAFVVLEGPEAAGPAVRNGRRVNHQPGVDGRQLDRTVLGSGPQGLDQPVIAQHAIVLYGLGMAAEPIQLAESRRGPGKQRGRPLRAGIAGSRIAEQRDVEPVARGRLHGPLRGIRDKLPLPVLSSGAPQRKPFGRNEAAGAPLWIDRAEEEHTVLDDGATDRRPGVAHP